MLETTEDGSASEIIDPGIYLDDCCSMEIERKFLVRSLPAGWKKARHSRIRQGYFPLAGKQIEIRVREKGRDHFITIKSGWGKVRLEEEIEISQLRFARLWPLVGDHSVVKTRYEIPFDRKTVEMDVYEGPHRGLITADVEFNSEKESRSFKPPGWCAREITGQRRYANEVLARRGRL
jgi:adenylate cyclase